MICASPENITLQLVYEKTFQCKMKQSTFFSWREQAGGGVVGGSRRQTVEIGNLYRFVFFRFCRNCFEIHTAVSDSSTRDHFRRHSLNGSVLFWWSMSFTYSLWYSQPFIPLPITMPPYSVSWRGRNLFNNSNHVHDPLNRKEDGESATHMAVCSFNVFHMHSSRRRAMCRCLL